jgi:hypothetical protein
MGCDACGEMRNAYSILVPKPVGSLSIYERKILK